MSSSTAYVSYFCKCLYKPLQTRGLSSERVEATEFNLGDSDFQMRVGAKEEGRRTDLYKYKLRRYQATCKPVKSVRSI